MVPTGRPPHRSVLPERTPKVLRQGTHRSKTLENTLRQAMRLAPVMGITRVANVTGLDSIGIPVVMVCRPNSRSLAVSQGKGIDLASAKASGLMESIEQYHAETITLPLRLCSYEELRYSHCVVEVEQLPRVSGSRFHPSLRLPWCAGRDLLSGEEVFVPYEMVHTNYTYPLPEGHGCFSATSNGLASGNHPLEAVSHGICEIVERDATALWHLREEADQDRSRLDLGSVDDPACRELLGRLEGAGMAVAVWDVTSDIAIAAFACTIVPQDDYAMWHCSVATGYGCHPSRQVALARALTEAAQFRLTIISGARDDAARDVIQKLTDPALVRAARDRANASSASRCFYDVPHWEAETLEEDVDWELEQLTRAGVNRAIAVDLTKPEFGLSVVRMIIPGLEAPLDAGCIPGERARRALTGSA